MEFPCFGTSSLVDLYQRWRSVELAPRCTLLILGFFSSASRGLQPCSIGPCKNLGISYGSWGFELSPSCLNDFAPQKSHLLLIKALSCWRNASFYRIYRLSPFSVHQNQNVLLEFKLLCMIHTYSHHDLGSKLAGMVGLSCRPQASRALAGQRKKIQVHHGKSHEMPLNHN